MTPLTLAWIGLGNVADHQLAALDHLDGLAVPLGGYDPDAQVRARYNGKLKTYSSLDVMLRRKAERAQRSSEQSINQVVPEVDQGHRRHRAFEARGAQEYEGVRGVAERPETSAGLGSRP